MTLLLPPDMSDLDLIFKVTGHFEVKNFKFYFPDYRQTVTDMTGWSKIPLLYHISRCLVQKI